MNTRERIEAALSGIAFEARSSRDGIATCELASTATLHEACGRLRDRAGFETNTLVTAIDRFPDEPRFEVLHQFLSLAHRDRVRIVTRVRSEHAEVPTIVDLYPGAAYSERECFDMFGVRFAGHAGLKRLLMPEDYDHFPLRKDFPHQGIEPDRLYRQWEERRHRRAGEHGLPRHPEDQVRVPPADRLARS